MIIKKIIIFLTLTIFFISSFSTLEAQNINAPFVGTWQWQNGNQVFKIELRKKDKKIRGDFYMIEVNSNGIVTDTIYKSNKDIGHGLKWGPVIYGGSRDGIKLDGFVNDNVDTPNSLSGNLKMIIQTNSPSSTTATWKVKRGQGLRLSTDNRTFTIPTDIILTKVQ